MFSFARSTAIALPLLLAAGGGTPSAQEANTGQPCGGPLCDLYAKIVGRPDPQPGPVSQDGVFSRFFPGADATRAAAQKPPPPSAPVAIDETPAPTDSRPFNEGPGGLLDAMRGLQTTQCSGSLCGVVGRRAPAPVVQMAAPDQDETPFTRTAPGHGRRMRPPRPGRRPIAASRRRTTPGAAIGRTASFRRSEATQQPSACFAPPASTAYA